MKILNSNNVPEGLLNLCYDFIIIGAGAAGIYAANKLASQGYDILILEAGGSGVTSAFNASISIDDQSDNYNGAISGRYFGIGGSTAKWGGTLVPHHEIDKKYRIQKTHIWNKIIDICDRHQNKVLLSLGIKVNADFQKNAINNWQIASKEVNELGFQPYSSRMLNFKNKNFKSYLKNKNITLLYNACVFNWSSEKAGTINSCSIYLKDKIISLKGSNFIITSGALESTRIIMEIDKIVGGESLINYGILGKNLSDHLSCTIGYINNSYFLHMIENYSPRFFDGIMNNFRWLPIPLQGEFNLGFLHLIFENENSGFKLAKELLSAIQSRQFPKINLSLLFNGIVGFVKLGYYRYIKKRLYISEGTKIRLQFDMEQTPNEHNRLELSDKLDELGRKKLKISWSIDDVDIKKLDNALDYFKSVYNINNSLLIDFCKIDVGQNKPHDAYHPVGTTPLGNSEKEGVVDFNYKVFGYKNLFTFSTALLPSAGTANPTFTILCMIEDWINSSNINND